MLNRSSLLFHLLAALLLVGSTLMLFWDSVDAGFLGDDYYFLVSSNSWENVQKSFVSDWFWHNTNTTGGTRFYRPFQILLTYVEYRFLWGENPWGYHLDLFLIHIANALLVAFLVGQLLGKRANRYDWIPWLAAFAFALHPRHTESVCMINGRTDSLCALFYIASLVAYLGGEDKKNRLAYWMSILFFVGALLSKEMAITLPALLLVYDIARYRKDCIESSNSVSLKPYLFSSSGHWLVLILVFGILRTWALGGYVFGKTTYITPLFSLELYFLSLCKLGTVLFLPFEAVLNRWSQSFIATPFYYGGWIVGVWMVAFGFSLFKGNRLWSLSLAFLVISAQPVMSQLTEFQTTLSDRYLYIPSIAVPLALAAILQVGFRVHQSVGIFFGLIASVLIAAFIPQTSNYVGEWRTAGETAASIRRQIEALDDRRPIGERFCFLSMPVLYQGKVILDTGYERYINDMKIEQKLPMRILTPLVQLDLIESPETVTTQTIWSSNQITQRVQGGNYRFPLQAIHPQIQLTTDNAAFPTDRIQFSYNASGDFPLLLLAFDRGNVVPISTPIDEILIAQGSGGNGFYQRSEPYNPIFWDQSAVPDGVRKDALIDPQRGIHLNKGDVDGDGKDDIIVSLGPTDDPKPGYPGLVMVWSGATQTILGHPFSPFPRHDTRPIANPSGEVRTAVGYFIPGRKSSQIACAQGVCGKEIIRLYEYTGKEQPNAFQIVGQFLSFTSETRGQNEGGGIAMSSADFNRDGLDELALGQTKSDSCPLLQIVSLSSPDKNGQVVPLNPENIYRAFDDTSLNPGLGVEIATGDVNGDGIPEILTAPLSNSPETPIQNPWINIWKVQTGENDRYDLSLFGKFSLSTDNPGSLHSIRLACGNIDMDPCEEIVAGLVEQGQSVSNYIRIYDLLVAEDGSFQNARIIMNDKFDKQKSFWQDTQLGWLDVTAVRR